MSQALSNSPSISQTSSCCSAPHGQRMYSERRGFLHMITSTEGRIALVGVSLAFVHCAGLVLSLYFLISCYLASDRAKEDDPSTHLCTDAMLCILFRFGPRREDTGHTTTALAGQLLYSLLALTINLVLVGGALGKRPSALLGWLVFYLCNIIGCFVLTGILAATVIYRHQYFGDIHLGELSWIAVPLVLAVLYLLVWTLVLLLYIRIKRNQSNIFAIED